MPQQRHGPLGSDAAWAARQFQRALGKLVCLGHGGAIDNPEALGFMLRAFFDTVRRHIAFEREYVFPLAVTAPLTESRDCA